MAEVAREGYKALSRKLRVTVVSDKPSVDFFIVGINMLINKGCLSI